jgi:quercetin dioxygenase-like cupin family protein
MKRMTKALSRRNVLGSAGVILAQTLMAQNAGAPSGSGRKVVFEHDVPDLSLKNWSTTVIEVSYGPGESSAAHRHPGITVAYVLEGEIRSKVGDDPERTYSVGQVFLETPNQLHAVSRNASTTKPARLLAVMLAEKGKQLTTPA